MSSFLGGGGGGSGGGPPGQLVGAVYNSNYNYLQPTTGTTVALNNTDYQVILDPTTALGSLNLTMPPAPFDGQIMEISASTNISGFAMLPSPGQVVDTSPNALAAGSPVFAVYRAANHTWYITYSVPYLQANGNLNWYVSTTGSDSNPGTAALPFATLQHAINVSAEYDWQGIYFPQINIAAGTYSGGHTLNCFIAGTFKNLNSNFTIQGSSVSNCFFAAGQIQISNITVDIANIAFTTSSPGSSIDLIGNGGLFIYGPITFSVPNSYTIYCQNPSNVVNISSATITYTDSQIPAMFYGAQFGSLFLNNTTFALPVALATTGFGFFVVSGPTSSLSVPSNTTWVNFGGTTGPRLYAAQGADVNIPTGVISADIPGSTDGTIDNSVQLTTGTGKIGLGLQYNAGIPTTTQVANNCWGVWKDTTGGGVYVVVNDAGTIKKVQLI